VEIENALDLYSTSQTGFHTHIDYFTGEHLGRHVTCEYGAPLVAYIIGGRGYLSQGCCNHWDCRRCGIIRAKTEYRRIVDGCELLAETHKLYFWTLTCRGREMPLEEAEENYLAWTNVLLTNARTKCKRAAKHWAYVQVTERQKKTRAHPHSHIITTYLPDDAQATADALGKPVFVSEWFSRANSSAGLGAQHKITEVGSAAAVSRYVAKYLFKDTFRDVFPKNWKRVRYSANFPRTLPVQTEFSVQLSKPVHWQEIDKQAVKFVCESHEQFLMATKHCYNVTTPMQT